MRQIKWTMSKDQKRFTAESDGYKLIVSGGWYGWGWQITKNGIEVDDFMHYPPTNNHNDSTTVRVACERAFTKLLDNLLK